MACKCAHPEFGCKCASNSLLPRDASYYLYLYLYFLSLDWIVLESLFLEFNENGTFARRTPKQSMFMLVFVRMRMRLWLWLCVNETFSVVVVLRLVCVGLSGFLVICARAAARPAEWGLCVMRGACACVCQRQGLASLCCASLPRACACVSW